MECSCRRGQVMRILSVCLSVCLSVKRVNRDKTKETCAHILKSYNTWKTSHPIVFGQELEECWWGGATTSTWNFGSNWSCWSENADFQSIFARSASAVTPSEKSSISTNRKSTTRFPMSPRWTSYVVPNPPSPYQSRAQKRSVQNLNNKLR